MRNSRRGQIDLSGAFICILAALRATVNLLRQDLFGDLARVEKRSLADGPAAFSDLQHGMTAAAQGLLKPTCTER